MDARYLQATTVLPHQNKVCGRNLRAFCLRHRVALEAIKSPFLNPGKSFFTAYDVAVAVRILSTHDKNQMNMKMGFFDTFFLWRMKLSRKFLFRNIGRIIGHINSCVSYPKFWEKNVKTVDKVPWTLTLVSGLCRNGIKLEEAWTMPESEAVWFGVANAIYNGSKINVLTTDEEAELEKFNERIEAYKKQMNHN